MEIFTRERLIKQLKEMIDLLKKCPKDMKFHAAVEFSGIDPRFMELASQMYIKREAEHQKALAQIKRETEQKKQEGNI